MIMRVAHNRIRAEEDLARPFPFRTQLHCTKLGHSALLCSFAQIKAPNIVLVLVSVLVLGRDFVEKRREKIYFYLALIQRVKQHQFHLFQSEQTRSNLQ